MAQQPLTQPDNPGGNATRRAPAILYTAAACYISALGMAQVLIPLYALHLGYDVGQLGLIVGSQAIFGILLRIFGGAMSDQLGERTILWAGFSFMIVASLVFALSGTFWALILAQFCMGISRASYWTSSQSYASRLSQGRIGEALGRVNAFGNIGQILGTFIGGVMAGTIGYGFAFTTGAGLATVGLLVTLGLPTLPRKVVTRHWKNSLAPLPRFFKHRGMAMAAYAAFFGSSAMALGQVLLIPYFEEIGFSEALNGSLRTVLMVGAVATGMMLGQAIAWAGEKRLYVISYGFMGVTLLLVPFASNILLVLFPLMLCHGMTYGILGAIHAVTTSTQSAPEERGMAMAYSGTYWSSAQFIFPAGFGFLAQGIGLTTGFWLAGGMFIGVALVALVLYNRLIERPAAAAGAGA
ncbi:MAG: MFS transporter [Dehalococcoidia bacterium]